MTPNTNHLTGKQVETILNMVNATREHEYPCSECLNHLGEFTEAKLTGTTQTTALEIVEHHLSICSECTEEFEALLRILKEAVV